jgi:hypothetical protein
MWSSSGIDAPRLRKSGPGILSRGAYGPVQRLSQGKHAGQPWLIREAVQSLGHHCSLRTRTQVCSIGRSTDGEAQKGTGTGRSRKPPAGTGAKCFGITPLKRTGVLWSALSGTDRNLTNNPALIIKPEATTDLPACQYVWPPLRYSTDDLCPDRRVDLLGYSRGFDRGVDPPNSFRGFRVSYTDPTRKKDGNAYPKERRLSHEGKPREARSMSKR